MYRRTYCLHRQTWWWMQYVPTKRSYLWRWRQYVSPKRLYVSTSPHGAGTQKVNKQNQHFHSECSAMQCNEMKSVGIFVAFQQFKYWVTREIHLQIITEINLQIITCSLHRASDCASPDSEFESRTGKPLRKIVNWTFWLLLWFIYDRRKCN
jgi:hypothetical protein